MSQHQAIEGAAPDQSTCPHCGARAPRAIAFCGACGATLAPDPLIGKQIDERYEVVRCLGQGGMGTVYEVQHLRLRKRFAMKFIRRDLAAVPGFSARFEREALATSKQKHPNCVAVTDFGHARTGELYLVMEYLEGQSLRQFLGRPMPVQRALSVVRQVLLALQHAHKSGIVHRDVKSDNVMLMDGPDGEWLVKVLDFGLAVPAEASEPDQIGDREALAGTPTYMAPEQFVRKQTDERSDLYAVGVILWYLLTGRPVFDAETPLGILRRKACEPAPSLDSVAPGVFSSELQALVAKALEREPERRFASAEAFLGALAEVQRSTGGGLATTPGNPLLRLGLAGLHKLSSAWTVWYRGEGAERPTWRVRLRRLSTSPEGHIVTASSLALLLLLSLTVLGVSLALRAQPESPPRRSTVAATTSPPAAPPAPGLAQTNLERRFALVRLLISKGACREAALDVEALLRDAPHLALAHQLLGAAEICRGRTREALAAYERAIAIDPRFRRDSRIVEDVGGLLVSPPERERALAFLTRHMGRAALEPLLDATTSPDADFRARAIAHVIALGASSRIDWLTVHHLDLEQRQDCAARARAVEGLSRIDDKRALRVLLDARSSRGRAGRPKHACVREQLDRAIKALQRRLGS